MNIEKHYDDIFFNYKILTYPETIIKLIKNEPTSPINLEINLTNICNQRCIWCTYDYLHSNSCSLGDNEVENLLRDANKLKIKSITWTGGGEPTIHKSFNRFALQAASYGIKQGLNTNCLLLENDIIDIICNNFTYIRISLDAASPGTYEQCHGIKGEKWNKVINNIKDLVEQKQKLKSNVTVGISFLISEKNYHEIEKVAYLAKNIGVDYIQYKPVVDYGFDKCNFYPEKIWDKSTKSLRNIKDFEDKNFSVRILDYKFNNIKDYKKRYNVCWACKVLASVGADGYVDLCCAYKGKKRFSLGNIKENSFYSIWQSNKIDEILSKINIHKCPPLCKGDEINRITNFIKNFNAHKEFV